MTDDEVDHQQDTRPERAAVAGDRAAERGRGSGVASALTLAAIIGLGWYAKSVGDRVGALELTLAESGRTASGQAATVVAIEKRLSAVAGRVGDLAHEFRHESLTGSYTHGGSGRRFVLGSDARYRIVRARQAANGDEARDEGPLGSIGGASGAGAPIASGSEPLVGRSPSPVAPVVEVLEAGRWAYAEDGSGILLTPDKSPRLEGARKVGTPDGSPPRLIDGTRCYERGGAE